MDFRSEEIWADAATRRVRSCAESGACSIAAAARSTSASGTSATVSLRPEAANSCPSSMASEKCTANRALPGTAPGSGSTSATVG